MKYLDYSSLLTGPGLDLALFSTFRFDPDYFERRLLRCPGLAGARRIVVLMDGTQWSDLLRREPPTRFLNRHYLVAPVHQKSGVFHPKLALLISPSGGQVLCGSNNLTRAGCSSNLELLNAVPFDPGAADAEGALLAREAFAFFREASRHVVDPIRRIVTSWLDEVARDQPWLQALPRRSRQRRIALLHSYTGSLWDQLEEHLGTRSPRTFFVMAPFHDPGADSCRRLTRRWPRASVELAVQQGYTNLQPGALRKLASVRLTEVLATSRRLHAKLVAWSDSRSWGCLVGSANFTRPALDGPNTEACLLVSDIEDPTSTLFDRQLRRRPIGLGDFEPGSAEAADDPPENAAPLHIDAAVLVADDRLELNYSHGLGSSVTALRLEIRTPSEPRPRIAVPLCIAARAREVVRLPAGALTDAFGTVLATLSATAGGAVIRSAPVWIVQERHLTFEPADTRPGGRLKVEETGEGLTEILDEIGATQGIHGVIEYLQHLSIRFFDGSDGPRRRRTFRIAPRDSFVDDRPPDWLLGRRLEAATLGEALYEFVDRHMKLRLRKHATRGNINGMANFVDIFTTLTRLLLVYYRRGVVKRSRILQDFCRLIALATQGRQMEEEEFEGFLSSAFAKVGRDSALLQEVCDETNYLGVLRAALVVVQDIRTEAEPTGEGGGPPARPRDMLGTTAGLVRSALRDCRLAEPPAERVEEVLVWYGIPSAEEVARLLRELPPHAVQ